ncbi:autotransporter outer membrane beta-barrel domain-containing protein [Campylobacter troglodytis]|uniref:autotransporter outer membrane beta-barrel domain-containing protein n=1 Tax=Campylobacter troglodytis TaxID=654363 RepID=UPI00163C1E54|nr:autotransporter outer membrane beta-barrel domain-containing protein [Campylobacter troglodytis]
MTVNFKGSLKRQRALKKQSKKDLKNAKFFALLVVVLCVNEGFGADYANSLPSSLTLASNANENSKAIANCTSVYECIFGNDRGFFSYSTSGSGSSTLTLTATLPQNPRSRNTNIPFYYSTLNINPRSNLILNGFESLSIENAININNASLKYSHTTNTSGFGTRASGTVNLNNNARFEIKAAKFTNYGNITLNANSTLVLETEGNTNTNNYGKITNNNSKIEIKKDLWNLGQKNVLATASPSSIATITNNGGSIIIEGNLYNGGQNFSNNVRICQIGFCGGGELIINGGSIQVKGKLISTQMDGQRSSIAIYGGTLEVNQGLENKQGSTLSFGVLNGVMGKLQGNLTNSGAVVVNMNGASLNQGYQIINGSITGLDSSNLTVQYPNLNLLYVNFDKNSGTVSINTSPTAPTNPPTTTPTTPPGQTPPTTPPTTNPTTPPSSNVATPSKFDQYKESLNSNEKRIVSALASRFGGEDKLLASNLNLQTVMSELDESIQQNYIASPQNMINAIKGDALLAPLNKNMISKPMAALDLIRIDTGKSINPFEPTYNYDFFANYFSGLLRAKNLKGSINGFNVGFTSFGDELLSQINLSYAYGSSKQDLTTQSTNTKGRLFSAGGLLRHSYGILESDFNVNFLLGDFEVDNKWLEESSLDSSSSFNNYQANLGLVFGTRFGEKASFKPFLGVQNYFESQEGFKQDGGLGLESKAYNAYVLDALVGFEARYNFYDSAFAFAKFSYENKLYNSHKQVFMRVENEELSYENETHKNAVSVNLGMELFALGALRLNGELLYKHYNTGLDYYGGNLLLKYKF